MIQNVVNKKKIGDFLVLPASNVESEILIDNKKYKIKYCDKRLNLSQCSQNKKSPSSNPYEPYKGLYIIPKKESKIDIYDKYYKYTYHLNIDLLNRYEGNNEIFYFFINLNLKIKVSFLSMKNLV